MHPLISATIKKSPGDCTFSLKENAKRDSCACDVMSVCTRGEIVFVMFCFFSCQGTYLDGEGALREVLRFKCIDTFKNICFTYPGIESGDSPRKMTDMTKLEARRRTL